MDWGTPNSKLLLSLMVKAWKLSELNPMFGVAVSKKSNEKNNASTNKNFSFSSRVLADLANNFFLQGLWERTNSNDSRINSVFILLFYIFLLAWLNSRFSRKPVNCEAYILGSFHIYWSLCHVCEDVPWTWITLFTLSKIWKIRGRRGCYFYF